MIVWSAMAFAAPPLMGPLPTTLPDQVALHLRLDGRGVDPDTLEAGYQTLCDAGTTLACRWRAFDDFGRAELADLARVATPMCRDDAVGCLLVAWGLGLVVHDDGLVFDVGATDTDRALDLLESACTAGVSRACTDLGRVLEEDRVANIDTVRAEALHRGACDAGVTIACVRIDDREAARALGAVALSDPATACGAGVAAACASRLDTETLDASVRLQILETLCTLDARRCPDLAAARRNDRGVALHDGKIPAAWVVGDEILLRPPGAAFQPHSLMSLGDFDRVEIEVDGREHVRLIHAEGTVDLPTRLDCDLVVEITEGLEAAGILPRAIASDGRVTLSRCIDGLGPGVGPVYLGGEIRVDPNDPADVGQATTVREALVPHEIGALDCGAAASTGRSLDPVEILVVHKRDDVLGKRKVTSSSGDPAFDTCIVDWLSTATIEPARVAAKMTVVVGLLW